MSNFITILNGIKVASSNHGVTVTEQFENINGQNLLSKLKTCSEGMKEGSHWLRGELKVNEVGQCMPRSNSNVESLAKLLVIDCDCSINNDSEVINGAPDPIQISSILKNNNIGHVLYGSYSHYTGDKGNRYRILLIAESPYNKEQLSFTAEAIVTLINIELAKLGGRLLAYAKENSSWGQPWYYPRRPIGSNIRPLYLEHIEGKAIKIIEPLKLPHITHIFPRQTKQPKIGEISVIETFNNQKQLVTLLSSYGYKLVLTTADSQKWLSPDSTSGKAGITVKRDKLFSYHNDRLNDGFWHDGWDFWRYRENLTEKEAIVQAAQSLYLSDGRTVDEHNKSVAMRPESTLSKNTEKLKTKNTESSIGGGMDDIEPYPYPIDPNQLLIDIENIIRRVIICNEETIVAAVLWIAMTWFIDNIQVAPLAVITAPEKRCGKSQLLFLFNRLVRRPLPASNITPASLFRSIEAWSPTILIDEADAFLKDNEELRGIINCGHTRDSAFVIRTIGKEHTPHKFNVWSAKAIAGIGHLSETIMDRAIVLELRRKLPHEKVERLRYIESNLFKDLQAKLSRFSADYQEMVSKSRPSLPDQLNDRAQDNWEPLLAIASVVGHDWPKRAQEAALKMAMSESNTVGLGTELLISIKEIFEKTRLHRISTNNLIAELCADDEQPWATYSRGFPISPRKISKLLQEYGIKSKDIRFGPVTLKGFEKSQFDDAFLRYLSSSALPEFPETTQQINSNKALSVADGIYVAATDSLSATGKPLSGLSCCVVADNLGEDEEKIEVEI